jgi:hypothetical protein
VACHSSVSPVPSTQGTTLFDSYVHTSSFLRSHLCTWSFDSRARIQHAYRIYCRLLIYLFAVGREQGSVCIWVLEAQ